ncbi:MAG: pilus assembly protein, partial [Fuerstia sp.]|nr:pilus assembly protein [Fuerstiella sp.]
MQTFSKRIQNSPARNTRSAVAAVELAIVLPVLMALVVGVVESCNLIYIKQSLTISAYEGARAAIVKGMVVSDINDRSNQILADRKITNATILISPNPPSTAS